MATTFKNPMRISLKTAAENEGYKSTDDYLAYCMRDSVMPALCIDGCDVEPDGRCEHNCPSPLLAAGLI